MTILQISYQLIIVSNVYAELAVIFYWKQRYFMAPHFEYLLDFAFMFAVMVFKIG